MCTDSGLIQVILQLEKDLGYSFSLNISGCCDFARLEDEVGKSEVEDEDEDERDS